MKRLLAELEQEHPRLFANLLSAMRPLLGVQTASGTPAGTSAEEIDAVP